MRWFALSLFCLLFACPEPEPLAELQVEETSPEDGAEDFFYLSSPEVTLAESVPDAVVTLQQEGGAAVEGATVVVSQDRTFRFSPAEPLLPDTGYTARVSAPERAPYDWSFYTDGWGTPVIGDAPEATWYHALRIADTIVGATADLLFSVTGQELDGLDLRASLVPRTDRDTLCANTWPLQATGWTDPWFEAHSTGLELLLSNGDVVVLFDVTVEGVFAADWSSAIGVRFSALFDTRGLDCAVDEDCPEGALCDLFEDTLGAPCQPCPDTGEVACAPWVFEPGDATLFASEPLPERSPDDVLSNPACL